MESFDLNTRLPPRKRLLAGLKMASPSCDLELPLPLASSDLATRLRDVVNSASSSPEDIAEAAKSVALAAAEVAAAARAAAIEKATIAAKARAAAKSALELVDSISRNEAPGNGRRAKLKPRKKQVPIKLLYKTNWPSENQAKKKLFIPPKSCETDEELARKLHHAMNSSPRITNGKQKKPLVTVKEGISEGESDSDGMMIVQPSNGNLADEYEKETVVCSNADILEEENQNYSSRKRQLACETGGISGGRKAKVKRKKVLLSECCSRAPEKPKECTATEESNTDIAGTRMSGREFKTSNDGPLKLKITSMWKCKKLIASQCSSDSKILHAVCSGPPAAKTSAIVKVD